MDELILKKNINDVIVAISLKEIKNDKEYRVTGEWLKRVKETEKMVDGYFGPIKEQRYAEYKEVLNKIKKYKEPLVKVENVVKNMRVAYKKKIEEILRKQREEMMKLVDKPEEKEQIAEIMQDKVDEVEGVYHVEVWDFEIVDENKIPREYLIVDTQKIRKVIKAMGDKANISGVKVIKKIQERVRV